MRDLCYAERLEPAPPGCSAEAAGEAGRAALRALRCESAETGKRLRQALQECLDANKYVGSLYTNQGGVRDSQAVFSRNRTLSMPTATARAFYMVRSALLGEPLDDAALMQLFSEELGARRMAAAARRQADAARERVAAQVLRSSGSSQKAQAQALLTTL